MGVDIVLKIDNNLYEISKRGSDTIKIEAVTNPYDVVYPDIPCIYADTKGEHSRIVTVDGSIEDSAIENSGLELIGSRSAYVRIAKVGDKKLVFFAKKNEITKIFRDYAFSKIVPLDIILWRMGIPGINGIITNLVSYIRNMESVEDITTHETLIYNKKFTIKEFINLIKDDIVLTEKKKHIVTDTDIDKHVRDEFNIEQLSWKHFYKLVQDEPLFYIPDTVSDNYHAKIYKKVMWVITGLSIVLTPYLFYQYITSETYKNIYEKELSSYSSATKKINKKIDDLKNRLIYEHYKPINIDRVVDYLKNIVNSVRDLVSINFKVIGKKGKKTLEILMEIKSIEGIHDIKRIRGDDIVDISESGSKYKVKLRKSLKDN